MTSRFTIKTVPHFDGRKLPSQPGYDLMAIGPAYNPALVPQSGRITLNLPSIAVGSRITIDSLAWALPVTYNNTMAPASIPPDYGWFLNMTMATNVDELVDIFQFDVDTGFPHRPGNNVGFEVIQILRNYSSPIILEATDGLHVDMAINWYDSANTNAALTLNHNAPPSLDGIFLRGSVYGEKEKI